MKEGASLVIDGRVYDVVTITSTGDLLVEDVITLERSWKDFYLVEAVDPHRSPGAVLEAMAALENDEEDREAS
jgi:hypothetical protein